VRPADRSSISTHDRITHECNVDQSGCRALIEVSANHEVAESQTGTGIQGSY
jgi:hypothetical protein